MTEKEKRKYPQKPSLAVFKYNLRSRTPQNQQKYIQKHQCAGIKSVQNGISNLSTAVATPQKRNQSWDQQKRINWLKYNILVGIYENWIRLYPFIEHLLRRNTVHYGFNDSQTINNNKNASIQKLKQQQQYTKKIKESQFKQLFICLTSKYSKLLQKFKHQQSLLNDSQDIQLIKKSQKLTQQILSQLSLLNQPQIQTQSILIDQLICNIHQQNLDNYETYINNLKQKFEFLQEMQQDYTNITNNQDKRILNQKMKKIKIPLSTINNLNDNMRIQTLLEQLWLNVKNRKQNRKFVQTYAIKKPKPQKLVKLDNGHSFTLTANYKFNKSHYYNQSYILKKSRNRFIKKQRQCIKTSYEESLSKKKDLNKVYEEEQESFKSASNLPDDKNTGQINRAYLDEFVQMQKNKQIFPLHQNQISSLFIPKTSKLQLTFSSQQREVVQTQSQQVLPQSTITPAFHIIKHQRKSSIVKRGSFRRNRNIESQQELKQEHFSRFKSNKKGPTIKHIRLHQPKYGRNASDIQESQLKVITKNGKYGKEESKIKNNIRRGNFSKKLDQKKYMQIEPSMQQQIPIFQNGNFVNQKKEIIDYIRKIKSKGFLDPDKYRIIRVQTDDLLQKCSPSSLQQTREFANKMVQKTRPFTIQIPTNKQNHFSFLSNLREVISKDEQIEMKIKQQLKIYFQESLSYIPEQQQSQKQKMVLNSTEIRHLNYQLQRIMQFKGQNQQISLAKLLLRFDSNIKQVQNY